MQWRLFADLADVAGADSLPADPDADTVGEALDALLEAHPDLAERVREPDDGLSEHVSVLVDGADVTATEDGLDTELDGTDELALLPPVSGG